MAETYGVAVYRKPRTVGENISELANPKPASNFKQHRPTSAKSEAWMDYANLREQGTATLAKCLPLRLSRKERRQRYWQEKGMSR